MQVLWNLKEIMSMPSTNTEEDLRRWEEVKAVASECGGAFKEIRKFPKSGEYTFEAEWNPEFVKSSIYSSLSVTDILCLVDKNPWYFGGKLKSRSSTRVTGVVYTD